MMKLGFVSAILGEYDFDQLVDFASDLGFSCVEIMCWPLGKAERRYAGITHINVGALDGKEVERIRGLLAQKNLEISSLGYYPNPLDADEKTAAYCIEHLKKVITGARKLSVPIVTSFIGRDQNRNIEDNLARFREVWPSIIAHAEKEGITLCIENCPMFFTNDEWPGGKNLASSPLIWRRMFEIIPSDNFGLNYDPSHLVWQHMDYIKPIFDFSDRIQHVHIKDAKVLWDRLNEVGILVPPLEYHAPKLPGLGDVDWGKFFSALTDIGYRGPVCIEIEDREYDISEEMRITGLVQSRDFVRRWVTG